MSKNKKKKMKKKLKKQAQLLEQQMQQLQEVEEKEPGEDSAHLPDSKSQSILTSQAPPSPFFLINYISPKFY